MTHICKACGSSFKSPRKRSKFCNYACRDEYRARHPEKYGALQESDFWSRVNKSENCWLWTGPTRGRGYGAWKNTYAHRYSYRLAFGDVPESLSVLHRCDVPACVNPNHLFLGTHQENMEDMKAKHRSQSGDQNPSRKHPELMSRGTDRWNAKLNPEAVRQMRSLAETGMQVSAIAKKYGVNRLTARSVVKRLTWRHV